MSMMFGPIPNIYSLLVYMHVMHIIYNMRLHKKIPVNTQPHGHTSTFWKQTLVAAGIIDMLEFTFSI